MIPLLVRRWSSSSGDSLDGPFIPIYSPAATRQCMNMLSPRPSEATQKRTCYRRPLVVAAYERQRFGGASGAWVNERELATVLKLLPATGRVLDLGCGTGRLSQRLVSGNYEVILLDASDTMLARAVPAVGAPAVLA